MVEINRDQRFVAITENTLQFAFGSSWNGRGVLIIDGELDSTSSWQWDGIVLAGEIDDIRVLQTWVGGELVYEAADEE